MFNILILYKEIWRLQDTFNNSSSSSSSTTTQPIYVLLLSSVSFQYERLWALVPTRTQCKAETSHTSLNYFVGCAGSLTMISFTENLIVNFKCYKKRTYLKKQHLYQTTSIQHLSSSIFNELLETLVSEIKSVLKNKFSVSSDLAPSLCTWH